MDKRAVLSAALEELGFRRVRLMSYWNIHEREQGEYNFEELDWQLDLVAEYGGMVTLCVGKRQPRWPECHMPAWAAKLPKEAWYAALYKYIEAVVTRYKDHPALSSWQLENEALLREFGYCVDQDYSHARLEAEYRLIKALDPNHPVIMTLSDSWGLPVRRPKPDAYALSLYRKTINKHGNYAASKRPPLFYAARAFLISLLRRRPTFIHELQAEPWLPQAMLETPVEEQLRHMSPDKLKEIVLFAQRTGLSPIDLWGLEWWYWLKETHARPECWQAIKGFLDDGMVSG